MKAQVRMSNGLRLDRCCRGSVCLEKERREAHRVGWGRGVAVGEGSQEIRRASLGINRVGASGD